MTKQETIAGGCACGEIRYRCAGTALMSVNCHCRECQRASGGAYAPVIMVEERDFKLESGNPSFFSIDKSNPSYLHRGFCPSCGSSVFGKRPGQPKLVYILAGSLDNPELHKPMADIFTEEAHSWDAMHGSIEKFPGMPPVPDDFGK